MRLHSFLSLFLFASSVHGVTLGFSKKPRTVFKKNILSAHKPGLPQNRTIITRTRAPPPSRPYLKAKKRSFVIAARSLQRSRPGTSTRKLPTPTKRDLDTRPTPQPTGPSSDSTTVRVLGENEFALIVPSKYGQKVSDAEADGISQCYSSSGSGNCTPLPDGFITAAKYSSSNDGTWVQVTGCINPEAFPGMSPSDEGGQFDVRYPTGAQCSFGGYGASFIELLEPGTRRFCIRCCAEEGDQVNCNSHLDRQGCLNAIPGTYDFPEKGISCG